MGFFDLFRRKAPEAAAAASPAAPPTRDRAAWQDRLCAHARERHAARPMPARGTLDPLQDAMLNVEGGFLTTWLRQYGPQMLGERRVSLESLGGASAQPIVVIHGDLPAVVAVLHIAGDHAKTGEKKLVALLDEDYDAFIRANPEAREFDFHISSWSRFIPAAPALLDQARALGREIDPAHTHYNHVNGTLWGPQHGLEVENLWSWDGARMHLIEEAIGHRRF